MRSSIHQIFFILEYESETQHACESHGKKSLSNNFSETQHALPHTHTHTDRRSAVTAQLLRLKKQNNILSELII